MDPEKIKESLAKLEAKLEQLMRLKKALAKLNELDRLDEEQDTNYTND